MEMDYALVGVASVVVVIIIAILFYKKRNENADINITKDSGENKSPDELKLLKAEEYFIAGRLDEAHDLLVPLTDKGMGRALFLMAGYYENGYGSNINIDKHVSDEFYEKAAKAGEVLAMFHILKDNYNSPRLQKYIKEMEELAAKGDVIVKNELVKAYFVANDCVNNNKIIACYKELLKTKYWLAKRDLALCYIFGRGMKKDLNKAQEYIRLLQGIDDPLISYLLADLSLIPPATILNKYRYAADKGLSCANMAYGASLYFGKIYHGLKFDVTTALSNDVDDSLFNHIISVMPSFSRSNPIEIEKLEEKQNEGMNYFSKATGNAYLRNPQNIVALIYGIVLQFHAKSQIYTILNKNLESKARKAHGKYASCDSPDEIIMVWDPTFWGGCECGVTLTLDAIYWRMDGCAYEHNFLYTELSDISIVNGMILLKNKHQEEYEVAKYKDESSCVYKMLQEICTKLSVKVQ